LAAGEDLMSRAWMKPLPWLVPPRPWWHRWMILAVFVASVAVVPTMVWLLK